MLNANTLSSQKYVLLHFGKMVATIFLGKFIYLTTLLQSSTLHTMQFTLLKYMCHAF